MSLLGALGAGASGVKTYGRAMTVIGSNIANVNTFGYKTSRSSFEDILSSDIPAGTGKTQISQGVGLAGIHSDFTQGAFEQTSQSTDMAINGDGFFTVHDEFGNAFYTRNGQFQYDQKGFLSTDRGLQVQVKDIDPLTGNSVGLAHGIKLLGTIDPPVPTGDGRDKSGIIIAANLDSGARVLEEPFDPTNVRTSQFNFSTTVNIFDKGGAEHTATIVFRKRPEVPEGVDAEGNVIPEIRNQWEWYTLFDGAEIGQRPGQNIAVGGGFMQFDDEGRLEQATGGTFVSQGGGIDPETGEPIPTGPPILQPTPVNPDTGFPQITIDFGENAPQIIGLSFGLGSNPLDPNDERTGLDGVTQFSSPSKIQVITADGHPSGQLEDISVSSTGVITGQFDSGYHRKVAKIVLTSFDNPGKLEKQGDNLFARSPLSGRALLGDPGIGGLGEIRSQTLEQSNVDLADEFVKMIETQRAFQASAKTVITADEMITEIVQMKR